MAIVQSAGRSPVGPPLPVVGVTGGGGMKTKQIGTNDRFLHLTFDLAVRGRQEECAC